MAPVQAKRHAYRKLPAILLRRSAVQRVGFSRSGKLLPVGNPVYRIARSSLSAKKADLNGLPRPGLPLAFICNFLLSTVFLRLRMPALLLKFLRGGFARCSDVGNQPAGKLRRYSTLAPARRFFRLCCAVSSHLHTVAQAYLPRQLHCQHLLCTAAFHRFCSAANSGNAPCCKALVLGQASGKQCLSRIAPQIPFRKVSAAENLLQRFPVRPAYLEFSILLVPVQIRSIDAGNDSHVFR